MEIVGQPTPAIVPPASPPLSPLLENTLIVKKFPESQDTLLILVKMVRYNAAVFLAPADINMQSSETGLPSGWEVRHSQSKDLPYYFNLTTAESRWEPPDGSNVETLNTYIGKHHSSVSVRVSDNATDGKIRASHLLVKHRDSRRPSSWKETNITRTKEEAINLLKGYEEQIKSGKKSLGELARSESDDSSARKDGDLGFFGKNMMQKEFENAVFALKPGEISGIVETDSGVHLIERIQ
jgi:peptidyl-prolyl cis-trans isomerase NIMA-interacting 1